MRGFTKYNFKLNLKVSAFYLEKLNSFIPKKYIIKKGSLYMGRKNSNRWRFAVPIFREGFAPLYKNSIERKQSSVLMNIEANYI